MTALLHSPCFVKVNAFHAPRFQRRIQDLVRGPTLEDHVARITLGPSPLYAHDVHPPQTLHPLHWGRPGVIPGPLNPEPLPLKLSPLYFCPPPWSFLHVAPFTLTLSTLDLLPWTLLCPTMTPPSHPGTPSHHHKVHASWSHDECGVPANKCTHRIFCTSGLLFFLRAKILRNDPTNSEGPPRRNPGSTHVTYGFPRRKFQIPMPSSNLISVLRDADRKTTLPLTWH